MAYEPIVEQLKEKCNCTEVNESDVEEMINLVSMATCWTQEPCETFLMSSRKEVIDLPDCLDECEIFEFRPFYRPFIADSFTFTVVETEGLEETLIPVTEFVYSEVHDVFRLKLPLKSCKCCMPNCGCSPTYSLLVTYDAGYEEIPDCLIPVFCMLIAVIKDKNECDCDTCQTCDNFRNNTDIQQYVYANGDVVTPDTDMWIAQLLQAQYKRQLGLISLCQYRTEMWSVIA